MTEKSETDHVLAAGSISVAAGNAFVTGAVLLLAGFVTSALFLVVASILWTGSQGVISVLNAALWYVFGLSGLAKSAQGLATFRKRFQTFTEGLEKARNDIARHPS